jgi:hypothetical protein
VRPRWNRGLAESGYRAHLSRVSAPTPGPVIVTKNPKLGRVRRAALRQRASVTMLLLGPPDWLEGRHFSSRLPGRYQAPMPSVVNNSRRRDAEVNFPSTLRPAPVDRQQYCTPAPVSLRVGMQHLCGEPPPSANLRSGLHIGALTVIQVGSSGWIIVRLVLRRPIRFYASEQCRYRLRSAPGSSPTSGMPLSPPTSECAVLSSGPSCVGQPSSLVDPRSTSSPSRR